MPPKPRSAKPIAATSSLLTALQFVGAVTKTDGAPFEKHVVLKNNWAVGFNGVIAAGHKIEETFEAYPHNEMMIAALSKCGESFSITELENNRLSIKSDKFKAIIPCVEGDLMHFISPDPIVTSIDDRFKKALETVGVLAEENSQSVVTASILMNGFSLIATDRKVVMEYWHGCDLPPNITLPKAFVTPLTKTKKKLAQFGFSNSSATFYFEDDSWIKTQFYADPWPDVSSILNRKSNPWNVPEGFFEAVAKIEKFSEDGNIYFDKDLLKTHPYAEKGAQHEITGIPQGVIYPAKYLMMLKGKADKIDFVSPHHNGYCLAFFGENIRGVIAGRDR